MSEGRDEEVVVTRVISGRRFGRVAALKEEIATMIDQMKEKSGGIQATIHAIEVLGGDASKLRVRKSELDAKLGEIEKEYERLRSE
jgi:hypothetical protein